MLVHCKISAVGVGTLEGVDERVGGFAKHPTRKMAKRSRDMSKGARSLRERSLDHSLCFVTSILYACVVVPVQLKVESK